jgi:hypothetical protein
MSKLVSSTLATVSTVKTKTPPGRGLHEADDGDRTRDPQLGKPGPLRARPDLIHTETPPECVCAFVEASTSFGEQCECRRIKPRCGR